VIVSITRLMNHGLVLISPIVLVRLLTVEDFGRYREFLLYSSVLLTFAGLSVNSSLMRFAAYRPEYRWRFVNQALLLTMASSALILSAVAALNAIFAGALVGDYMLPLALYVALFLNFDFWEHFWLAERRPGAVFAYTTGRLVARLSVVIAAAALSGNVTVIIWSLVCLEAIRLLLSAIAWAKARERHPPKLPDSWREQLQYCLPVGASSVLVTLNKSMGSLIVAKVLGPVGLAQYAIGTYVQPIIAVLRNSMSDVLLPEMSADQRGASTSLTLWRRMTVLAAIMLVAAAVILARFAEVLVVTIFSPEYLPAAHVLQIFVIVLVRESIDFAVPLRAINRTAPMMKSNLVAMVVNAALLFVLLPIAGVRGAAISFVISQVIEVTYLGRQMAKAYDLRLRELANWGDLAKVALAAAIASGTLYGSFWPALGLLGVVGGACCFLLVYATVLVLLRMPDALLLLRRVEQVTSAFVVRRWSAARRRVDPPAS
jgi:O-antigen/teichoic acid export membrane protein